MYIDPLVSEWIETERQLCMPLFSSNGIGVHLLTRLYSDRVGIDLDTVSVPEYAEAIRDWKLRVLRAFDRPEETEPAGKRKPVKPMPRKSGRPAPLYLEGYINQLLLTGIVTLDNYHLCLQMPVCTFFSGVQGAIALRDEVYKRQGDLMAEIANIFGNGKKKFKSSDFYNTSHTEPVKLTASELFRESMMRWGVCKDTDDQ